ncbi:glycine-rich protein [Ottowia sp.]|uniref:glycine-rich protein n=1 Tax=Ottowia sp. TaxID=1898956 RepID=UPI001DE3B4E3|nr:glycine-rich protein [Ottowia sp.]MCB2035203.1 IPTL-CTERM sorting domain-containing protein [Ottowia sp.]MCP5256910.1 IPTL-CTERM sorting domain-containing protein [Burkholderiaceae bacterium]HPR44459.1 glycine-rich protein [Ottowia sp.]HRW72426.1 glycine-rich protein [Ottowia sp.]
MIGKKALLAAALLGAVASGASAATATFSYTGAAQTWTVPAGVTQVTLDLRGAQGGGSYPCSGARQEDGGLGGQAQGTLAVTPGQVLNLYVGGQAVDVGNITPAPGGFNGGGDGGQYGAGGGGATDVRVGGTALANRVAVAGGGGGGNTGCPEHGAGGNGGGLSGDAGTPGVGGSTAAGGGTQSSGGTAGAAPGVAGQLGLGGSTASYHIGGGGGGYYGGGSAYAAGGGGGSSYIAGLSGGSTTPGVQSGNGSIVITYADAVAAPVAVPTMGAGMLTLLAAALAAVGAGHSARQRRRRG